MSKVAFVLDDEVEVVAPVNIRVPKSVQTNGRGAPKQMFETRTAYVTFRLPSEDELDEVNEGIKKANEQNARDLADARKRKEEAGDDDAAVAAEEEIAAVLKRVRIGQAEQLKAFIVGLPDNSGIVEKDNSPAVYSPELVERLCNYRHVRAALWDAFVLILNGDGKRGN